jgi:DNA processing protein
MRPRMDSGERRAVAALWCLQGIGPKTILAIERALGALGDVLRRPVKDWLPLVQLPASAHAALSAIEHLAGVADRLEQQVRQLGQTIIFPGDPAWPPRLSGPGAPRVLFMIGPGAEAVPRRRVAIVGTRKIDPATAGRVLKLAAELASAGVGVISGAAEGIDMAAHHGALRARGETWAFMGAAIDQLDPPQCRLLPNLLRGDGTCFSHYPPGTRSDISTFSRRNPLISGASDAVLVARAPIGSGALQTAKAAIAQGRPLLVLPADPWNESAMGSNQLLEEGKAKVCVRPQQVLEALGLTGGTSLIRAPAGPKVPVSMIADRVLEELRHHACDVDTLVVRTGLDAGQVASALVELEVEGYVLQRGSGLWEKA